MAFTLIQTTEPLTEEQLAALYAAGLLYKTLLDAGEPLKTIDVVRATQRSEIDTRLARVILATNPHFTATDRKWTLWTRYLDQHRPMDSNIMRIFDTFGQPIRLEVLARELESVYNRPAVVLEEMLESISSNPKRFVRFDDTLITPLPWLLDTEAEVAEIVGYENNVSDDAVLAFSEVLETMPLEWNNPASWVAFLDAVGKPVDNKTLQFMMWRIAPQKFNPAVFYSRLYLESGAIALMNHTWIGPETAQRLIQQFPIIAQQEVADTAEATEEEIIPLVIGPDELELLISTIESSENTSHAGIMLEDLFEVMPDFRTYDEDKDSIINALKSDERVRWLGRDRFRSHENIPAYVFTMPGLLEIPVTNYEDEEGNLIDQLLTEAGLDGGLEREILNPLVQDVLDEEPVGMPDLNPPSNARAIIKYHHKQIGTMPLCQFAPGFFPIEPMLLEAEFVLPNGQPITVWINNETRLIYGLLDWFEMIPIDSGATFTIERKAPDRYVINYNDETEPAMFVSRNRVNELLELQELADNEGLATFDVIRRIMEHYRKGIEYQTLHTEANIVRRTSRLMVASIISEYHCFFMRGGAWVYDQKRESQGFDKSKRKYLLK